MGKKCALFLKIEKLRKIKVNRIFFKTAKKCLILNFLNKINCHALILLVKIIKASSTFEKYKNS